MGLELDIAAVGGQNVIAVKGDVDLYTSPRLRAAVLKAIDQGPVGVDLREARMLAGVTGADRPQSFDRDAKLFGKRMDLTAGDLAGEPPRHVVMVGGPAIGATPVPALIPMFV